MKPMPNADENRRLGEIENTKARKLPAGAKKEAYLEKAREHESSAHSEEWRGSHLHKPS
jgi:hypothetical protein